ncbi:MAG: hypothetical protein JXL81_01155, partial [Deltaproteobacteria bacterium]|nr:hypothetical protein [Deltaproteobacteria bacterium]
MNKLQDLNILPATNINGASVGLKSGSNNGNGLFQSILDTLNGNGHDSNWVSSLYSDTSTKGSFNPGNINVPIGLHGKNRSHNALSKGGHNHEDMIIPASLQIQLVAFLEKQGFSLKDINQALSASKNANGLIRLDSLLSGLSGINSAGNTQNIMLTAKFKEGFSSFLSEQGINPDNFGAFFSSQKNENVVLAGRINSLLTGNQNENSYIDSSQIPGVQEILFNMGLGAGDVKKIIESSKNGNGELLLEKLSAELNRFLSAPLSESDLSTIFSKNSISVDKRIFDIGNSTPNTVNLSADKNIHLTDEAQKQVKNDIELLLKEQGISE